MANLKRIIVPLLLTLLCCVDVPAQEPFCANSTYGIEILDGAAFSKVMEENEFLDHCEWQLPRLTAVGDRVNLNFRCFDMWSDELIFKCTDGMLVLDTELPEITFAVDNEPEEGQHFSMTSY